MQPQSGDRVETYIRSLHLPLSVERLHSYERAGAAPLDTVTSYFWNVALSEALHPALEAAEVALRNSIHAGLSDRYGTENWFDAPGVLLGDLHDQVERAREWLRDHDRPTNPGRVIAQLHFGFWVVLLNKPYEQRVWEPAGFALLRTVFPHLTRKQRKRWLVQQRFWRINRLRNRVMHYEPLWNNPRLSELHEETLEAISWISPELRQTVERIDRFPAVYSQAGRETIAEEIRRHIGDVR